MKDLCVGCVDWTRGRRGTPFSTSPDDDDDDYADYTLGLHMQSQMTSNPAHATAAASALLQGDNEATAAAALNVTSVQLESMSLVEYQHAVATAQLYDAEGYIEELEGQLREVRLRLAAHECDAEQQQLAVEGEREQDSHGKSWMLLCYNHVCLLS